MVTFQKREAELSTMLTHEEKRELLTVAREAIGSALYNRPVAAPTLRLPGLMQCCGLFVTIKIDRQLRGCIGYIESNRPLVELVPEIAVKSALEDPRFPQLTPEELEKISLELSILSPLRRIHDIDDIIVGSHGLLIELGPNRGLLLPQVAVEFRWDRNEFLEATARKAGLYRSAWQDPEAHIFVFTAEILREAEVLHGTESDSPAL